MQIHILTMHAITALPLDGVDRGMDRGLLDKDLQGGHLRSVVDRWRVPWPCWRQGPRG